MRPSGTTPLLSCPLETGGKWGGFCQVLVNNLQHPKNREPSPSRQCHDVVPSSLNFCSPFPLSFLPVGALNPIPATWGWGGICFTRGISTSVNKSLIESHLSRSSQSALICPKGKQNAIFPPKKTPDLRSTLGELWNIPSPSVAVGKAVEASASIPTSPLHVFCHPSPKIRVKARDGWHLDVLVPAEHPSRGALPVFTSCTAPGIPRSGNACSVLFTRHSAQIWIPAPQIPRELLVL